ATPPVGTTPAIGTTPPANPQVAVKPNPPLVAPTPPPVPRKALVTTYAAAFPVAPDLLVTSASAIEGATQITIQPADGNPFEATVVSTDTRSGLALLRATGRKLSYLGLASSYTSGPFQCVSFPTVNVFDPVPEVISGSGIAPKEQWTV